MNCKLFDYEKKWIHIITAGATYLDIDAYACAVAMAELLQRRGECAVAYSTAPYNYSVCESLVADGQILRDLPDTVSERDAAYIIVDVSDPEFLKRSVPLDRVVEIYDHHVGFEDYWQSRIGNGAHIEFIGAAATLIYREWKASGLVEKMSSSTAKLLVAAILDNTLNLTSSNTTDEDRAAFSELCQREAIDEKWCASYFAEVQKNVETDLKNAIFKDIKRVSGNEILPPRVAQICVWDACRIFDRLDEIRAWFAECDEAWMINVIDLSKGCSFFVSDDERCSEAMSEIFNVKFINGVAKSTESYLRKEIIKKTIYSR